MRSEFSNIKAVVYSTSLLLGSHSFLKGYNFLGKKVLQASDTLIDVILIDATEQPIERALHCRTVPGKKR